MCSSSASARQQLRRPRCRAGHFSHARRLIVESMPPLLHARPPLPRRRSMRHAPRAHAQALPASMPGTAARDVNTPLHVTTPLVHSNALTAALGTGAPVFLKLDCAQPCGSFKLRGIGAACQRAVSRRGAQRLVSSSGGNAGLAVAYCARALGVQCTVVRRCARQGLACHDGVLTNPCCAGAAADHARTRARSP